MANEHSYPGPGRRLFCPSAQPDWPEAVILGVVLGTAERPRLVHLNVLADATPERMALATPATPTEVYRLASPCIANRCPHFDGADCHIAKRVVAHVEPESDRLPACLLRPICRWWHQEGRDACVRCSQVVTDSNYESMRSVAEAAAIT